MDAADIEITPPRPMVAFLPVATGAWMGFEVDRYPSQLERVRVRTAVTRAVGSEADVVGEFPVALRGKVGSVVTLVPKSLVGSVDLSIGDRITTIAVAPGLLLFVTESLIEESETDMAGAIEAARNALSPR